MVSSNDPTKSQSIKCSHANESGYSSAVSTSSVVASHDVAPSGDRQEDTPRVGGSWAVSAAPVRKRHSHLSNLKTHLFKAAFINYF